MKKIFISHASTDEPIIRSLIDDLLVGALSVKVSDIFCATTDGTKIESGENWRNSIQAALQNSKVTLLIITPNYKESEVCMCEMGAAWVTSAKVLSFFVEPITYSSVGILQEPKQVETLLDEKSLDRLRDVIQEVLAINPKEIRSDRWTVKKMDFLKKVKRHLKKSPFHQPLSRDEFQNALKEKSALKDTVQSLIAEQSRLKELIETLKKAKDAKEVKEIEKKHKKETSIDEFRFLCKNVSVKLAKLPSIVRGILFVSHSGKNLRIGVQGWREEIDDALSRDYITEDLEADWTTSNLMREIDTALNDLGHFLSDKEETSDFIRAYEEDYEAPLSLSNREFWEEAFELDIAIS